ncbi:MAG: OB-fold nucleic acid binding domain-containing protein, partial [Myxococcota bacterium]|nr:OB-fold nucleic acid binding domain-containing protein [Myxococcota bacterium]
MDPHSRNSSSQSPTPLERGLAGLLRPLEFAIGGDGANLGRLRELETTLVSACRDLQGLDLPAELVRLFHDLELLLAPPMEGEERLERLRSAWSALSAQREVGWADAMLGRRTSVLSGVGARRAESLAQRGIATVSDLLFHLPSRYEDRRRLSRVSELEVGRRATFVASVLAVDFVSSRARGRMGQVLQALVGDEGGTINLKWFRGGESIAKALKTGDRLLITGDVKRYRFSKEIVHPEVDRLDLVNDAAPA